MSTTTPLIVKNCQIVGNDAREDGGGIYHYQGLLSLSNSLIAQNEADGSGSSDGGGIYYKSDYDSTFTHITVADNYADDEGGGLSCSTGEGGRVTITNSIFWSNEADENHDEIDNEQSVIVYYSDVHQGWHGPGGINIEANPLFRLDEYHLESLECGNAHDSPCIDKGNLWDIDGRMGCDYGLGTDRADQGAYGGNKNTEWHANIIYVPHSYSTIQEAIANADDGDTILVAPNIYSENIDFHGKAVTVRSIDPYDPSIVETTIIDGSLHTPRGSTVTFQSGEGPQSILEGFTIMNGSDENGGGIYCVSSSPIITRNRIMDNSVDGHGGGIYCSSAYPIIVNNIICNNSAGLSEGGGIYCVQSNPEIINNLILENSAARGGGIFLQDSFLLEPLPPLANNTFIGNSAAEYGGCMALDHVLQPL